MVRFWLREIAGWGLVALGLYVLYVCFGQLVNVENRDWLLEAGPLTLIGIIIFRGGIHLLKVAVAAQVCMQSEAEDKRRATRPAPKAPAPEW